MTAFMVYKIVSLVFSAIYFILFASIVMSWLIAFGIVSTRNPNVMSTSMWLERITDPILGPIRAIVPSFNGLDFSVIIAYLLLQYIVEPLVYRAISSLFMH